MNNSMNFRKLLVILLAVSNMVSPLLAVDLPELSWEKRSDWIDVKTDVTPAAKGDGVADDTEAIQAAFNKISHWEKDGPVGGPKTVYLPAGTYRITKTINMPVCYGLSLIGQGRKTVVSWDGETSPTVAMYQSNGCSNARYEGIVWNGNGKAAARSNIKSKALTIR